MTDDFDPYYTWLGIPPDEQPATHYRLLGVRQFEPSLDVISNAGDQRMAFLRTFQVGKRSTLSQRLLNEMAAAKVCLLDPDRRKTYDEKLKAAQPKPVAPAPLVAPAYSPPSPAPAPPRPAPVARPLPVATRPPTAPDPFALVDPFTDAAREVQVQPKLPAKPHAEGSGDYAQQLQALARAAVRHVQELSPLAAGAYGVLALGVLMLLSVGLWIGFGGNRQSPQVAIVPAANAAASTASTPTQLNKRPSAVVPVGKKKVDEIETPTNPASTSPAREIPSPMARSSPSPTPETTSKGTPAETATVEKPAAKSSASLAEPVVAKSPSSPPAQPSSPIMPPITASATAPGSASTPSTTVPPPVSLPDYGPLETVDGDAALVALRGLGVQQLPDSPEGMSTLMLSGTKITDDDAKYIGAFPKIQHLYCDRMPITGRTLRYLQKLPQLKTLALTGTKIGDNDLAFLSNITSLESLMIRDTAVTASGVAHLKGLTRLRVLDLPQGMGRNLFSFVSGMEQLQRLSPTPSHMSDDDLVLLSKLTHLRSLDLQQASLTLDGYKHLERFREVDHLTLNHKCPREALASLKNMQLNHFSFPESARDEDVAIFQSMPTLRAVYLNAAMTDQAIVALSKFPALQQIGMGSSRSMSDGGLAPLRELKSLNEITFSPKTGDAGSSPKSQLLGSCTSLLMAPSRTRASRPCRRHPISPRSRFRTTPPTAAARRSAR